MHQEKQGSREGFRRGKLAAAAAVVLPAVGIMALTGCLQQLCGSWLDGLSQQALTFDTTRETETDASDAIVTTAADEDAVVTFADADLTRRHGRCGEEHEKRDLLRMRALYRRKVLRSLFVRFDPPHHPRQLQIGLRDR